MDHPPLKMALFVGHEFSHERDNKPSPKIFKPKVVFRIQVMIPRMWRFGRYITGLGVLESVAIFGLSVELRDTHNTAILQA
jgi:hypothetical protein